MRVALFRAKLRLKQRGHKEGMAGDFQRAHLSTIAKSRSYESGSFEVRQITCIYFEVTKVFLVYDRAAIDSGQPRAGFQADLPHTGKFVSAGPPIRYGTRYGCDDRMRGRRIVLFRIGVGPTEHVPRVFDQGVLKSAAGSEEGHSIGARIFDPGEHPFKASIGTAGRGPESVLPRQHLSCIRS